MRKDYTHISILLDRSGSMNKIRQDTIGGVNSFIAAQKELPGVCTFSMAQFNQSYQDLYRAVPIHTVRPLDETNFVPSGNTALIDAICKSIDDLGNILSLLPEYARPEKVIFVIVTDGEENCSREHKLAEAHTRINRQRSDYNWEFLFIGADQDAIQAGYQYGIPQTHSFSFTSNRGGTGHVFAAASSNIASYRGGQSLTSSFSPEQRKEQEEAARADSLQKKAERLVKARTIK